MFHKCNLIFSIERTKKIMLETICAHAAQKVRDREVAVALTTLSVDKNGSDREYLIKVTLSSRELQNIFSTINLLWYKKEIIKASIEEVNAEFNYEVMQPNYNYCFLSMVNHSSMENVQPFYRNLLENYKVIYNTYVDYRICAAATKPGVAFEVRITIISPLKPLSEYELEGLTSMVGNLITSEEK